TIHKRSARLNINTVQTKPNLQQITICTTPNVVGQAGSVANGQTRYKEQAGEWSGVAEVGTGRVHAESGSKQREHRIPGTGAHGKQYTKALITGLV
ncbi:unnamed protein product, partial [Staurois parvus]